MPDGALAVGEATGEVVGPVSGSAQRDEGVADHLVGVDAVVDAVLDAESRTLEDASKLVEGLWKSFGEDLQLTDDAYSSWSSGVVEPIVRWFSARTPSAADAAASVAVVGSFMAATVRRGCHSDPHTD